MPTIDAVVYGVIVGFAYIIGYVFGKRKVLADQRKARAKYEAEYQTRFEDE